MPDTRFSEESFFFMRVADVCRAAVTCPSELDIIAAARLMRKHKIAGLVVTGPDAAPAGLLSVGDLSEAVAEYGAALEELRVEAIMHTGVFSVRDNAYVFEAIFKMAKNGINRLAVIDEGGNLAGVINATDLLTLQTNSPIYLTEELARANSLEALRTINRRILDMVGHAMTAGADTRSLVQLISFFNDSFTERIIALLDEQDGVRLPEQAAFLALGSEGRGEQTLRTDQDSAMVHADNLSAAELEACAGFAEQLVAALEFVGIPRCPGDTMASNPQWRHSLSEWRQLLDSWISLPKGEHMVNFGMFQDFRTIHGDTTLEAELHHFITEKTNENKLFFPYVAKNIVRFPAPIGLFGRLKVERKGNDRGRINLKKAGIFAISGGVSLLALEHGIADGTTWDKLEQLAAVGVMAEKDCTAISEAFSTLVDLRLQLQLSDLAAGRKPGNAIDPLLLTDASRSRLREALHRVNQLLRFIRDRYRLDMISR
jgi:CBS domain-containing protein